jgi:hypothetical protein
MNDARQIKVDFAEAIFGRHLSLQSGVRSDVKVGAVPNSLISIME